MTKLSALLLVSAFPSPFFALLFGYPSGGGRLASGTSCIRHQSSSYRSKARPIERRHQRACELAEETAGPTRSLPSERAAFYHKASSERRKAIS